MREIFMVMIGAILVENFVLTKFLGICPFLGVSKKLSTAIGMSVAVTFVMTISSAITWVIDKYLLQLYEIEYLQTITFILVISSLVQLVEIVLKKTKPLLYDSLGIFLPLITTNCAVLGLTIIVSERDYTFLKSTMFGFGVGLGFTLVLILFSSIREKLDLCDVPSSLKGLPIALIAAAMLSIAFIGFQGLSL